MREEARYDGQWVLRTNRSEPPEVIPGAYKQLWMVEGKRPAEYLLT